MKDRRRKQKEKKLRLKVEKKKKHKKKPQESNITCGLRTGKWENKFRPGQKYARTKRTRESRKTS